MMYTSDEIAVFITTCDSVTCLHEQSVLMVHMHLSVAKSLQLAHMHGS